MEKQLNNAYVDARHFHISVFTFGKPMRKHGFRHIGTDIAIEREIHPVKGAGTISVKLCMRVSMCVMPFGVISLYLLCVVIRISSCNLLLNGDLNGVLKAREYMLNHNISHLDKLVHV